MAKNIDKIDQYIEETLRTDLSHEQYEVAAKRIARLIRLEHAGHGIVTEAGEIMDIFKRHIFYATRIDKIALTEETGDLMWYVAILMDELEVRFGIKASEILETNIAKLRQRYPEKFSEENALNRDLISEKKILEKNI